MAAMTTVREQEVAQALVGDVEPEQLDAYRFAAAILPVFPLIRSLFSQNEVDTCLKLMLLHEVSRAGGRFSLDRIRALVSFLEPSRVDALVRSLRDGGWLDLRASDNTYAAGITGMSLLALLASADFGSVTPANVMARAAQTAEFNANLDGARPVLAYLLDQLQVLLDQEVDQAEHILRHARPARMISWSRRQHIRQLSTIREVLKHLEEHLDDASREFGRVVQLHEGMQALVGMHTSIHRRLRDWNLERLYTSEAGYGIPQLVEAIMGVDDQTLEATWNPDLIQVPTLPPALGVDEIRARFHYARRRLKSQRDQYVYESPPVAPLETWQLAEHDDAAELRARLTAVMRDRGPGDEPLELDDWILAGQGPGAFPAAAWSMGLLSRLQGGDAKFALDDGRTALVSLLEPAATVAPGVPYDAVLDELERLGALRQLPAGRFTRLRIAVLEEPAP